MTNNKKRINMNIDKDLWDMAGAILPCNRTEFFERQLSKYINSVDDIEELEKEIKEMKMNLEVKIEKLEHMKVIRESNSKNKVNIDKAMDTVARIILNNGCITKEQIKFISNANNILKYVLEEEIRNKGYKII